MICCLENKFDYNAGICLGMQNRLGDLIQPPLEIILSSGVFRRVTASGFYPWGKVDSPRKRVAE